MSLKSQWQSIPFFGKLGIVAAFAVIGWYGATHDNIGEVSEGREPWYAEPPASRPFMLNVTTLRNDAAEDLWFKVATPYQSVSILVPSGHEGAVDPPWHLQCPAGPFTLHMDAERDSGQSFLREDRPGYECPSGPQQMTLSARPDGYRLVMLSEGDDGTGTFT